MRGKKFSLALSLLLLFSCYLFSEEIVVKSPISSVTIYPDRATINREINLSLSQGTHSVVFNGLPATLIPNSLRASGKGDAIVKILGIDLSSQYLESPLLPEIKKLQSEIDALLLETDKARDRIEVLNTQEIFLKSIESSNAAQASREVRLGKPDIQSWERVINFLGDKLQEIKNAKIKQKTLLKGQQTILDILQKELKSIKARKPLEGRKVKVLLESPREGNFKLNLSYTVMNAKWNPLYTMRASPDSSEIEFAISSMIQQKSGENWENVSAFLSTSSPSHETNPPALNPWILEIYAPRPVYKKRDGVLGGLVGGVLGGVVGEVASPVEASVEAELLTAGILETGINLNFEIKRNIQIPSDGAPHKVPIDYEKLKVKYDYIAVPKLKEVAYLRGKFQNTLPYPLLSGNADLFVAQDFVGSTRLPFIAKEEETKMFFGEDRQIRIKHEQIKREKSGPGFLGKKERIKLAYKITIQNLRKNQVEIEVFDQLPLSQNTKIDIKDQNITPAPSEKSEKGMLSWIFTLAPMEKREILVAFTIEYPKGTKIRGL
ncbi:MAG: mucoidy inhibitor MuiA family protein [Candidatus Aminicenantes bacterium]|nr:mucoidy inhibitor MuiA family protein [Candidatus Aminicenantes bacterium]